MNLNVIKTAIPLKPTISLNGRLYIMDLDYLTKITKISYDYKKVSRSIKVNTILGQAKRSSRVWELIDRFERTISVLEEAKVPLEITRYMSLLCIFWQIPELDPEQVYDYLFYLQKKSQNTFTNVF
jgi:hypothetical protein